jgi:hypothetical protein
MASGLEWERVGGALGLLRIERKKTLERKRFHLPNNIRVFILVEKLQHN